MKTTIQIMAVANQSYIAPMMVMLRSLLRNNSRPIKLYLFYSDLEDKTVKEVSALFEKTKNNELVPIRMTTDDLDGLPASGELPAEVYFKLLGLDRLPETLDKILCLDLDMVVKEPLDELYDLDLSGHMLGACRDVYALVYGETPRNNKRLSLPEDYEYFNGGMLFFNLERIRGFGGGKAIVEECYKNRDLLKWREQDALNLLFHDSYLPIPWVKYNCPPIMYIMRAEEVNRGVFNPLTQEMANNMQSFDGYADYTQAVAESAAIIHYIGESKPWREGRPEARTYQIFDAFYDQYK